MANLNKEKDLLRFVTAGNIDDGKYTLIGRLLYEVRGIYDDQLDSIKNIVKRKGLSEPELALIVDSLKAEKEQGITIDATKRWIMRIRDWPIILSQLTIHFKERVSSHEI